MRWKSIIWTVLGLTILLGIIWLVNFFWLRPVNIGDFYERIVYDQAEINSEDFIQLPNNNRDHFSPFRTEFHDRTPNFYQNRANLSRQHLADLNSYPTKYLTPEELISYQSISHVLSQYIEAGTFSHQYHLIESFHQVYDPIFFLLYKQPVSTLEEAKTYTNRMRAIGKSYKQIIEGLKSCEEKGIFPPKSLVEAKIEYLKKILAISPNQHPLYLSYAKKLVRISRMEIKEYEQVEYLTSAENRIQNDIFPACEEFIEYLEELLPKTSNNYSDALFGENRNFYHHLLNRYLGSGFSPEELHERGKTALTELQSERLSFIDSIKVTYTFRTPMYSDTTYINSLNNLYLKDFSNKVEESGFKWAGILGTDIPQNIEIHALSDAFSQVDFFYQPEKFAGKSQAQLYLNSDQISNLNLLDVFSYTIPGKHYQTHQQIKNDTLSLFSRMIRETAIQNGWVVYSQYLASDYGFLVKDYTNQFIYSNNLLLYIGLLVVDTGIFSQNWSIEEAKAYLKDPIRLNMAESEIWLNRILAQPGKYTTYWMGYQRILALRERAKSVQGLRFNIADFHQWMLKHQTVPLSDIDPFFEDYLNSPTP